MAKNGGQGCSNRAASEVVFLFREARGMVRPFINTHQAETRTTTRTRLDGQPGRPLTQPGTSPGGLKQASCIDLQVFSKLVESA